MNKKEYTLILLQSVQSLFSDVRKFVDENSDILILAIQEPLELLIEDKSNLSTFKFSISNPQQSSQNKIIFDTEFNPQNGVSLVAKKAVVEAKTALTLLNNWTNLIRQYNEISLTQEDRILKEYENEFYCNFEILDEDADSTPYNLEKQIMLSNYFTNVIKVLKYNETENEELIKEAELIKDNIPEMTKKETLKSISRFFAKVRKKSLPLIKEILEIGKKELFKKAITAGFDMIENVASLL